MAVGTVAAAAVVVVVVEEVHAVPVEAAAAVVAAVVETNSYIPHRLLMQWHITDRCNNRCSHCYQDSYSSQDPSFEQLRSVLAQYKTQLATWRKIAERPVKGQITITGGEPFLHENFFDLLGLFHKDRELYSFAILSNGSLLDGTMVKRLKEFQPRFVQVSIEGSRKTHDAIRGEGDYDRTVAALRQLVKQKIPSMISFTAHRQNFRELPQVVKLGRKLGVTKVWSDRLIPEGNGKEIDELLLTPEETQEYVQILGRESTRFTLKRNTEIAGNRALQFLESGCSPYSCAAADSLITVLPNGDLLPCRRMPIVMGNLYESPLNKLYYSESFKTLRTGSAEGKCQTCLYSNLCKGGLKCLSYATTGNAQAPDPGCWL